jgi:hypothetical protein
MADRRLVKGTRDGYKSKINKMTEWLKDNDFFESFDDNDNLKLPLDTNAIISFLGYIGQTGLHRNDNNELIDENGNTLHDAAFEGQVTKAVSTMGGYRSAIMDLYKQHKQSAPEALVVEMSSYMSGFKRTVSDLKLKGHMKIEEGRSSIPFTGYITLAKVIFKFVPAGSKGTWEWMWFGWAFFIFLWNLMARSHSIGHIMLQHMRWSDDCLIVKLPKHKGDQEGDRAILMDRHVYANPLEPSICPILSLATLIFCKGFRQVGGKQQVFEGNRTENKFSDMLAVILKMALI